MRGAEGQVVAEEQEKVGGGGGAGVMGKEKGDGEGANDTFGAIPEVAMGKIWL